MLSSLPALALHAASLTQGSVQLPGVGCETRQLAASSGTEQEQTPPDAHQQGLASAAFGLNDPPLHTEAWWLGGATVAQLLLAVPLSLGAGCVTGAAGFGSGIISIQGMVRIPGLGLTQLQATASSLGSQAVSALSGGAVWLRGGGCDLAVAACLAAFGLPGVTVGARLASLAPEATLRLAFAGVLCCVVCPLTFAQLWRKQTPPATVEHAEETTSFEPPASEAGSGLGKFAAGELRDSLWLLTERPLVAARHCAVGALVGVLTGAVGIGDAPVFIAYLVQSGFSQRKAIGTAMLATVPTISYGACLHLSEGNAIPGLVPILTIFMSIGASAGAKLSTRRLSEEQLKLGFAIFVLLLGLFVGWEVYSSPAMTSP